MLSQFQSARRVSAPLIAINTPDPAATIQSACAAVDAAAAETPVVKVQWDYVRGLRPASSPVREGDPSPAWIANLGEVDPTPFAPIAALQFAEKLPQRGILFMHLANRFASDPGFVQATWNLRDKFKSDGRTLVLLAKQMPVPAELSDDLLVLDEPLPNEEQLSEIVRQQHRNAGLDAKEANVYGAVEALRGLSAFAAEQITAMSLRKSGLNIDACWERKRQQIEQTPGLTVWRDGDKFESIGGCDVVKGFLSKILHGNNRPNAIVYLDELEKALAKGDLSGVSTDQLGALLSYMQDHHAAGMIFIGPPGSGKSAIAKAAGNEGGIPTIQLDLGAANGSLVGQSEQQMRAALKVITAVSNNRSLWIATCNSIADLPPELRRRFTLGTYFFDLPTAEERAAIWSIWSKVYEIQMFERGHGSSVLCVNPPPADDGWTGAEIKQCCDIAWRLGCSLKEAAAYIVPVSRSAADQLRKLREQADGRFLSASYPGVYKIDRPAEAHGGRQVQLEE